MTYLHREGGSDAGPDPSGHAAILLVEAFIHGLISRGVITSAEALEMVETAIEVNAEIGIERGDIARNLARSLALLETLRNSLQLDL